MLVNFVRISGNKKTGPMPVSTTERSSCPRSCALYNNGCYAENAPLRWHWDSKKNKISWDEFCGKVKRLRRGELWRHNQAGDLPGDSDMIDVDKLSQLVEANKHSGAHGFTFTHKPVGLDGGEKLFNAQVIYASNKNGFTINLSADDLDHADRLYDVGAGPVAVVLPSDSPKHLKTPKGRHVIVCPAEGSDIQCIDCGLCAKQRKAIVGFRAHGAKQKKINRRLKMIQ